MAKKLKNVCNLKGCNEPLNGGAKVGVEFDGVTKEILVCAKHAWLLMVSPPGTYEITRDLQLKAIPKKIHFDMKRNDK
jgi:hypothetical protein